MVGVFLVMCNVLSMSYTNNVITALNVLLIECCDAIMVNMMP